MFVELFQNPPCGLPVVCHALTLMTGCATPAMLTGNGIICGRPQILFGGTGKPAAAAHKLKQRNSKHAMTQLANHTGILFLIFISNQFKRPPPARVAFASA
jgi:hypothetical protein